MNATWALCPVLTGKPVKVTAGEAAGGLAGLMRLGYLHIPDFIFELKCVSASTSSAQFVEGLGFQPDHFSWCRENLLWP